MSPPRLKFVQSVRGRDGKRRHYFRRAGHDRVSLPGVYGAVEFMRVYTACLEETEVSHPRTKPGTIALAITKYFGSPAFTGLAARTRTDRHRILQKFRTEYGERSILTIQTHHIESILGNMTPATSLNLLIALRELMAHAVKVGLRKDDPTKGIRRPKYKSGSGFYAWTELDISKFESTFPIGTTERLAMALGLYLGQRRGDTIKLGRQHIRDGAIHLRQSKTNTNLTIPIHPRLQVILDLVPADRLVFLHSNLDRPFSTAGFSAWFHKACRRAGLPKGASFHGLRKSCSRRLAEAGCSTSVIASITGHQSLSEIARYTRSADQARLARKGIDALEK